LNKEEGEGGGGANVFSPNKVVIGIKFIFSKEDAISILV